MGTQTIKLFGVLAGIFTLLFTVGGSGASSTGWISGDLTLNERKTYQQPQDSLDMNSVSGNKIACNNYSVVVKPKIEVAGKTIQHEQRQTFCGYGVAGGTFGKGGWLLKSRTTMAGQLKPAMSTSGAVLPAPGSSDVIELFSGGPNANKVYIVHDAYPRLTINQNTITKEISYTLPTSNTANNLKLTNGADLFIDYNTIAFSENGQWMVADGLSAGFVRINIATGDVTQFTYGFSTSSKTTYSMNAISNDGDYVIVSAGYPIYKANMYDLNTCQPKTGQVYLNCANRDLQQYMQTKRINYYGFTTVRFVTNEAIEAYAIYDYTGGSTMKVGRIDIDTVGGNLTKVQYLALGDSFSSGEGAYNYRPETDIDTNHCHQSYDSYGYRLQQAIPDISSFKSVTCSGAKVKDVILQTEDEGTYNDDDSQAKEKSDPILYDNIIYTYFLPGYRLQKNFVVQNKPQIVTMSIGGNDIGFSSILQKCVDPRETKTCYSNYEQRKELVGIVNGVYPKLLETYRQLKTGAAQDAKIYIVGYPQIAKANGNCANNVHFNNDEIIFSNQLVTYLNSVIKMAADHAGVRYVDVEQALTGYRLCETASSKVAVHGLSMSDSKRLVDEKAPAARESYHPNKLGQQLLANAVAKQTNNLTQAMPTALSDEPQYIADAANPLLLGIPGGTITTVNTPTYADGIIQAVVVRNSRENFTVNGLEHSLKPNTPYQLTAYSSPTNVGTATSDSLGNIDTIVTIPGSLEPGYHTLHLTGTNILDEPIDLQKIIYVAASLNDYDGDSTANGNEKCLLVEPIGVDQDDDKIDDACDGFIDEAPPTPGPTDPPATIDAQNTNNNAEDIDGINISVWNETALPIEILQKQTAIDGQYPAVVTVTLPTSIRANITVPKATIQPTIATTEPTLSTQDSQNTPTTEVAGVTSVADAPISSESIFADEPDHQLPLKTALVALMVIGIFIGVIYTYYQLIRSKKQ